jgi:predicted Zn-dependent peptidase
VIVPNNWTVSTLPNGLRVVVTPISTAQSAAVSLWVGVGSRDETPATNGLSHYIEHMLFKGTERRPTAAMISEAIEGAGGGLNAFTTKEVTCYWNNLPYERVDTGRDGGRRGRTRAHRRAAGIASRQRLPGLMGG